MLHHVAEALIECDLEQAGTKASFKAARSVEFFGKEHGPGIGRPPQDGLIVAVPGENTVAVGFEQSLWSEVASDSEQAFWGGQINGREAQIGRVCAEPEHDLTSYATRRQKATVSSRLRKTRFNTQRRWNLPWAPM